MPDDDKKRRKRAPRLSDIARAAGVSSSTADRVLNERGSVSPVMQRKVLDAARRLQTRRVLPELNQGVLRFDIVLPDTGVPHYQRIDRAAQEYARLVGPRVSVHRTYWSDAAEAALIRFLLKPPHPRSGLLILARDVERIRAALRKVQTGGTPVVTITSALSDIGSHAHVGIDNVMAGRTAAFLAGQFAKGPGRVLVLVTSMKYRVHQERLKGFVAAIAQDHPGLMVPTPLEHHDQPELAQHLVGEALRRHGDVVAIYNAGSASKGIQHHLQSIVTDRRPAWVGHEVTLEHSEMMLKRQLLAVIDQDPEAQTLAGLRHLFYACGQLDAPPDLAPTRFRIVTPANLVQSDIVA